MTAGTISDSLAITASFLVRWRVRFVQGFCSIQINDGVVSVGIIGHANVFHERFKDNRSDQRPHLKKWKGLGFAEFLCLEGL